MEPTRLPRRGAADNRAVSAAKARLGAGQHALVSYRIVNGSHTVAHGKVVITHHQNHSALDPHPAAP
jgi:hypothetical protein